MRLACNYVKDGITASLAFADSIYSHVITHRPKDIIETGTYIGTGTTMAVIRGIETDRDSIQKLHSIEVNETYLNLARKLHSRALTLGYLEFYHGCSLPAEYMPDEIDDEFPEHIYTDHLDSRQYLQEVQGIEHYDILGMLMQETDYMAEMYILDSAGHLGTAEFLYITEKQKGRCYFFLDDTDHRKHYKTLKIAANDKRFKFKEISHEKFGHAVLQFNP
jgi:hypothetical protein